MNIQAANDMDRVFEALMRPQDQEPPDNRRVIHGFNPVADAAAGPPPQHENVSPRNTGGTMRSLLAQQIAADNINKLAREYEQTYANRPGALMAFGRQLLNHEVPENWTPEKIAQSGAAIQRILSGVINSTLDLKELLKAKGLVKEGGPIASLIENRLDFVIDRLESGCLMKYGDDLKTLEVVVKTWEEESGKDGLDGEHANTMFMITKSARDVIKQEMEDNAAEHQAKVMAGITEAMDTQLDLPRHS